MLPSLRFHQRPVRSEAQDDAVSLPRLPQAVQYKDRDVHGSVQNRLSGLGLRFLRVLHQPQIGLQHDAAPGVGYLSKVVPDTTSKTLQGFVRDRIEPDAQVYTDDASPYQPLDNHETVKHSHMESVRGPVHTNGVESFWSLLKRAHVGTFHKLSEDHLHRYVAEFSGRHNMGEKDTLA